MGVMRGGRERRREAKSVCGALVVELSLALVLTLALSDEEVVVLLDEAGVSVDAGVVEDEAVAKYRRETGDQHEIYLDCSDR